MTPARIICALPNGHVTYASEVAVAILALIVSLAAVVAGWNVVSIARKAKSFNTTRGTVVGREVATLPASFGRQGRWGTGGNYQPKVTYAYTVNGVAYQSDRWSYAGEGLKHSAAEMAVARVPDYVDVHYDPRDPHHAYLQPPTATVGYLLVTGGITVMLITFAALLQR